MRGAMMMRKKILADLPALQRWRLSLCTDSLGFACPCDFSAVAHSDYRFTTASALGHLVISSTSAAAAQVTVDLQLASVFAVDERAQTFSADVTLVTTWVDPRLRGADAPAVTDYDLSVLDDGRIWSPRLVFANMRDAVVRAEGVVRVHGSGRVVAVERFVGAFTAALDVRDFPFDTQTLEWRLRSSRYAHEVVRLVAASKWEQANVSAVLSEVWFCVLICRTRCVMLCCSLKNDCMMLGSTLVLLMSWQFTRILSARRACNHFSVRVTCASSVPPVRVH
jgi:hypothetical protein